MNILFIGNSYTYCNDLPGLVHKLWELDSANKTADYKLNIESITAGGRRLYNNLTADRTRLNPDDEQAVRIAGYLKNNKCDILVLQEQSLLPITEPDNFIAGAAGLAAAIKPESTILYATWGRNEGSDTLTELGLTTDGMTSRLYASYKAAAEHIAKNGYACDVSPAGPAFTAARRIAPEIVLYNPDCSHPSFIGSFLAALTHYLTIFGSLPAGLAELTPASFELDTDTSKKLISAAEYAVNHKDEIK